MIDDTKQKLNGTIIKECPFRGYTNANACTNHCVFWDFDVHSCAIRDALNKYLNRTKKHPEGDL